MLCIVTWQENKNHLPGETFLNIAISYQSNGVSSSYFQGNDKKVVAIWDEAK